MFLIRWLLTKLGYVRIRDFGLVLTEGGDIARAADGVVLSRTLPPSFPVERVATPPQGTPIVRATPAPGFRQSRPSPGRTTLTGAVPIRQPIRQTGTGRA